VISRHLGKKHKKKQNIKLLPARIHVAQKKTAASNVPEAFGAADKRTRLNLTDF
jgi:hypothetical protein